MTYPIEQLEEQYMKLPAEVQDAIASVEVGEKLQSIGESHRLLVDQIGTLYNISGEVMMGMTPPNKFGDRLRTELNLPNEDINSIIADIDKEIFRPIKTSLMSMYEEKSESMEHADLDRHQILKEIENPVRITYPTEPIELDLPAPTPAKTPIKTEVVMPYSRKPDILPTPKITSTVSAIEIPPPAKIEEYIAPETLAELPPSFRPSYVPPKPQVIVGKIENPVPPITIKPIIETTTPVKTEAQKPFVRPVATPPANLPTGEVAKAPEQKFSESARAPQAATVAPKTAPKVDPYREPVE